MNGSISSTAAPKFTVTKSGQADVVLTRGVGSGALANELVVQSNISELNVASLQSLHTHGYSSATFRDSSGNEVGSYGFCNASASVFPGSILQEISDGSAAYSGLAPRFILSQYTNFTGSGAAGHYQRLTLEQDGTINFWASAGGDGQAAGRAYATFDKLVSTFTLGPTGSGQIVLDASSSNANITLTPGSGNPTITGVPSLVLDGNDGNFLFTVRSLPTGRANVSNAFGGTVAQGGGFQVWTGGAIGSQVLRLTVGDDGIAATVPITGPNGSAMMTDDTGWTANADSGDKTAIIPSAGTLMGFQGALNALVGGAGDAIVATAQKCKALETALNSNLLPNA